MKHVLFRVGIQSEVMKSRVKVFRAVHVTREKCKENIEYDLKIESMTNDRATVPSSHFEIIAELS